MVMMKPFETLYVHVCVTGEIVNSEWVWGYDCGAHSFKRWSAYARANAKYKWRGNKK